MEFIFNDSWCRKPKFAVGDLVTCLYDSRTYTIVSVGDYIRIPSYVIVSADGKYLYVTESVIKSFYQFIDD